MKIFIIPFFIFGTLLIANLGAPKASALSGWEFQPGRIADDGVFFNGNGLDPGQIQAFLNSKVPSCDTNGTQPYAGTSASAYGSSKGYPPPYTCMKDYRQDTWTILGDDLCNGFSQGNKSAAQIIYEVGQSCGINQKVILVTLQKEQSLVADTWPWSKQYDAATGYACPDTAPCDPNYAGFFRQVYYGARQFKRYARDTHIFTSYRPYRTNYIQYNPNSACGGTNVYVQNQATSGLYTYTPYQPNAAALNNLYGTGDGCSAYGNRNFWRIFNDWFGSTFSGAFQARIVEHSAYPYLKAGQSSPAYAKFQNVGTSAWYDDISSPGSGHKPVRLATDHPLNNPSPFGSTWQYNHRPGINFAKVYKPDGSLSTDSHIAYPGDTVEFWFAFTIPHGFPAGNHPVGFRPIVEGSGPMNDTGSYIVVGVQEANYTASFAGQSSFPIVKQGHQSQAFIKYKNTGNVTWRDNVSAPGSGQLPIHLGTDFPLNRNSIFSSLWPFPHRAAVNFGAVYESDGTTLAGDQHKVQPGQIAKFDFRVSASQILTPGFYAEALRPIVQGLGPMNNTGTWMGITVDKANYTASFVGQSSFPTIQKGGPAADVFIKYKNTGNTDWYDSVSASSNSSYSTHLATDYPLNNTSIFSSLWPFPHRAAVNFGAVYESDGTTLAGDQHKVQPGQIAKFDFRVSAPSNISSGFYSLPLRPVVQGFMPMNDVGTWLGINVSP